MKNEMPDEVLTTRKGRIECAFIMLERCQAFRRRSYNRRTGSKPRLKLSSETWLKRKAPVTVFQRFEGKR
jgi:hypothetical protein